MQVTRIDNVNYYNRTSFGSTKFDKSVQSVYRNEILKNPEFSKLAEYLEKKGKDLLIKQGICGDFKEACIQLNAKPKGLFGSTETIQEISPFDNLLTFGFGDEINAFSADRCIRQMQHKDTQKEKNFIKRWLGL